MIVKEIVLYSLFFFFNFHSSINAQSTDLYLLRPLVGLSTISIGVEPLNPEIENDGLRTEDIQRDVELKLKLAGIKVIDMEEILTELGAPVLYINVTAYEMENLYALSISVDLLQNVYLVRDPNHIQVSVPVWQTNSTGIVGKKNVQDIRRQIKDFIDEFINDYLKVNSK